MSNYNLSEGLEDHFNFEVSLNGKINKYSMKYPSTKDLNPIRFGYARLEKLSKDYESLESEDEKKAMEEEIKKVSEDMSNAFTKLFAVEDGSMPIADLLEELPSNVRSKFDEMIQKELNVSK